jgi:PhnB protein
MAQPQSGVRAVPTGYHSITPLLRVKNAAEAIEWYKRALGAQEISRALGPGGLVWHAELQIGDSRFMLTDEFPEWGQLGPASLGGTAVNLHVYVEDADALFNGAVAAGATVTMPIEDAFWGDRYGKVLDPYGHDWAFATHLEDLSDEEMMRRGQEAMAQMSQEA